MACQRFSAKLLPESISTFLSELDFKEHLSFNQSSNIFIEENMFENVWEMLTILFWLQCVKHDIVNIFSAITDVECCFF